MNADRRVLDGVGVVLAGGRSRRMGVDKALLRLDGVTLLDRSLRALAPHFDELAVSVGADGPSSALSAEIDRFRDTTPTATVRVIADRAEPSSPLAALWSVLEVCERPSVFVVGVDMPEVFAPLIHALWRSSDGALGCMPICARQLYPTFAVYSRALRRRVRERLSAGRLQMTELAEISGMRVLDVMECEQLEKVVPGDSSERLRFFERVLTNINRPADFEAWIEARRKFPQANADKRTGRRSGDPEEVEAGDE